MKRLILVACFLTACGAETGNGLQPGNGSLTAKVGLVSSTGSANGFAGTDQQNTLLTVTSARAYIRSFDVAAASGANTTLNGPYDSDLISRTTQPALQRIELGAGAYSRIDARFSKAKPQDGVVAEGDPLDGQTMIAEGTIAYPPGQVTPFDLALHFEDQVSFQGTDEIEIEEGEDHELLLDLDVAAWFSALPITRCLEEGDLEIENGRIPIVDKGNNKCRAIEAALLEAIKGSAQLRKN